MYEKGWENGPSVDAILDRTFRRKGKRHARRGGCSHGLMELKWINAKSFFLPHAGANQFSNFQLPQAPEYSYLCSLSLQRSDYDIAVTLLHTLTVGINYSSFALDFFAEHPHDSSILHI